MKDVAAFVAFRKSPTPDSLMALLRAHQDRAYTVCLQVLRHPQDAEDAAQDALLKIASGAAGLREPRAFKCWFYRVVFRVAVDLLRQRESRRRHEEGRNWMTAQPLPNVGLDALHEAMAGLPDEDRLLLAEHYFEKTPLDELGRREGLSGSAMWKRIEKARERLKRGLVGAGFAIGASQVAHALESVTPTSAPAGLIGSAIVSKAALVAAGGMAVGAKTYSTGIVAGMAIIFMMIGAGGGYLVGARRVASSGIPAAPTIRGSAAHGHADLDPNRSPTADTRSKDVPTETPESAPSVAATKSTPAGERLARFKNWHKGWSAETWKTQAEYAEHQRKLIEQGAELRQIFLKEVDALLDFARDPENAECLSSLFSAAIQSWVFQSNGHWAGTGRAFTDDDVPSSLSEGLIAALSQGTDRQKMALISFGKAFHKVPETLLSEYRGYLRESSGPLLMMATNALRSAASVNSADLEAMQRNAQFSVDVGVRSESYKAVASARTPEALDWFFTQLLSPPDTRTTGLIAAAIREELYMHNPFPKEVERKATEALVTALARGVSDYAHGSFVYAGLCLSSEHAQRVLEAAVSNAPTEALRRTTERILESFRSGERNSSRLWSEYHKSN